MINVGRDSPRYHLLLAARFTRIDHGSESYIEYPSLSPPLYRKFDDRID